MSFFFFTQILEIVLISSDIRITLALSLNLGNSLTYNLNSGGYIWALPTLLAAEWAVFL